MSRGALLFLVIALVALSFAPRVAAFGAGEDAEAGSVRLHD